MQQSVALNPQIIEQIRIETGQEWRKCQRKSYQISACRIPAGYIFANCLEQPNSYKALMNQFNTAIVKGTDINPQSELCSILKTDGYYETSDSRVVLCGTLGELWDVKLDKLVSSYTLPDGRYIDINSIEVGKWFAVSRAQESQPSAMGIQIPKKYLAVFQTSWGTYLRMNDICSAGHGNGDIFVVPVVNGQLDYANASPTNNHVFAMTYNLGVGGWANSGLIESPKKIKQFTVSDCNTKYKLDVQSGITEEHRKELYSLTTEYMLPDTYERVMHQNEDLVCIACIVILRILSKYIKEHSKGLKDISLGIFDDRFIDSSDKYSIDLRVNSEDYGDYHITGYITESGKDYNFGYYGWAEKCNPFDDADEAWIDGNSIEEIYNNFVRCVKETQKKYNSL